MVSDLRSLHFFLEAGLPARLQEFRRMLADTNMVGIRVHPNPVVALYRLVLDSIPSSICMGSVQLVTISATLDCVIRDEIIVRPYDGTLLRRPELTIAIGQLRIRRWFWALTSWEFFLAERTFH